MSTWITTFILMFCVGAVLAFYCAVVDTHKHRVLTLGVWLMILSPIPLLIFLYGGFLHAN